VQSPNYERGALFIVYDEWGGFFDHVKPPSVRDDRQSSDLYQDFGQMGFRIPAVAISPFTRKRNERQVARVRHDTLGFESILSLIAYRYGLGFLNTRHKYATNIGRTFDWKRPQFEAPDLPDPQHVASRPCSMGGGDVLEAESAEAHVNDLAALEELAERVGVPTYEGKASDLFTKPDAMLRAVGKR
jgi:phospholipase C